MELAGNWYGEIHAVMKGKKGRALHGKQTNAVIQIFNLR